MFAFPIWANSLHLFITFISIYTFTFTFTFTFNFNFNFNLPFTLI